MLISAWGRLSYFFQDFSPYLILLFVAFIIFIVTIHKIYKSGMSDKSRGIVLAIFFSIFSLVVIFSGFEAYFRYRFDESDSLGFLKVTSKWYGRHVVTNNFQYRDRDFVQAKSPGVVRIGVMGDSIAFGYGIKDVQNRFSNLLEEKLKKNGYKAEVYNFAGSGLDTDQEIKEYQRVKSLDFDILVWEYFLNDVEPATASAGTKVLQNAQQAPPGLISTLSDNSYFFNYIYWRLSAKYDTTFTKLQKSDLDQYNIPWVFEHHTRAVGNLADDIQADGTKIVVVVFPFLSAFSNYPKEALEIHKRMDTVFTQKGVEKVVDLLAYMKGKQRKEVVVGPYDSHPNEWVHALASDKLYNAIVPLLEKKDGNTILKK